MSWQSLVAELQGQFTHCAGVVLLDPLCNKKDTNGVVNRMYNDSHCSLNSNLMEPGTAIVETDIRNDMLDRILDLNITRL